MQFNTSKDDTRQILTHLSHLTSARFGSFQVARTADKMTGRPGPSPKNYGLIRTLLDYVIKYHFAEISQTENKEEKYQKFLGKVAKLTAEMVSGWQTVG